MRRLEMSLVAAKVPFSVAPWMKQSGPRKSPMRVIHITHPRIKYRAEVLTVTRAAADVEQDTKADTHDPEIVVGFHEHVHAKADGLV